MLHRKLLICALFYLPSMVIAAGLGKITLQSILGEPLRAEVEILESQPNEIESITTRIANADEYAAAGLTDSVPPEGMHVTILRRSAGRHVLLIRSDKAMIDPVLELLVKIESRKTYTDLIRQYTVLLEPPTGQTALAASVAEVEGAASVNTDVASDDTHAAPHKSTVSTTKVANQSKRKSWYKQVAARGEATSTTPPPVQALVAEASYTTQAGDVFGKVAQKYQPAGVPLKKVMAVLFKMNPTAFEQGKMHRLKAGVVLQIPSAEALGGAAPQLNQAATTATPVTQSAPVADQVPQATVVPAPVQSETIAPVADVVPPPPVDADKPAAAIPVPAVSPLPAVNTSQTNAASTDSGWHLLSLFAIALAFAAGIGIWYFSKLRQDAQAAANEEASAVVMENTETPLVESAQANDVDEFEAVGSQKVHDIHLHDTDVLVEAEVLISYGHEEEAEVILQQALLSAPLKSDISLALLKIYTHRADIPAFERLSKKIYAGLDFSDASASEYWQKVMLLGQQVDPGNALYQAVAAPFADSIEASENVSTLEAHDHGLEFTLDAETAVVHSVDASALDASHRAQEMPAAAQKSVATQSIFSEADSTETIVLAFTPSDTKHA